jgi:hypothetical protein
MAQGEFIAVCFELARRALIMILEESSAALPSETAILSERALATNWNRTLENTAWAHLQPVTS